MGLATLKVNDKACKGCSLCVSTCPKKILALNTNHVNDMGYNPAVCTNQAECIGCAMCAVICPDSCIEVEV